MQISSNAAPVVVLAAGSLRTAFAAIIATFERQSGIPVRIEHGPAGLLREKIEQGAPFDVFASANMAHPERLHRLGLAGPVLCFARNRLCVIARRELGMTGENMIDVMLAPEVKLGTSTPKADPSGDYALAFFEMLDSHRPGAGKLLAAKAQALVGGRTAVAIPAGYTVAGWLIAQGLADVFVSYASNGLASGKDDHLTVVPLPDAMSPTAMYGVALRTGLHGGAALFRNHLFSAGTKQTLREHGFI